MWMSEIGSPDFPGDISGSDLSFFFTERRRIAKLLRGPRRLRRLVSDEMTGCCRAHPRGAAQSVSDATIWTLDFLFPPGFVRGRGRRIDS